MQSQMAIKPFANGELPSFPNNKDVSLDDNINAYTSKHLHNTNMQNMGFFTFISLNCRHLQHVALTSNRAKPT
jgi:hypothetical protein